LFATDECQVLDVDHPFIRFWWQPSPYKLLKFDLILMT
jgi:hypothetical protein